MLGYSLRSAAGNKSAGFSKDNFEIKLHFATTPQFSGASYNFNTYTVEPSLNNETVITSDNTVDKSAPYVFDYPLSGNTHYWRKLYMVEVTTKEVPLPDTEVFPSASGIPFFGKYKKPNVNLTDSAAWTSVQTWRGHYSRYNSRKRKHEHYYQTLYMSIAQMPGATEALATYRIYGWSKGYRGAYGTRQAVHMRTGPITGASNQRVGHLRYNNNMDNFWRIGLNYADHVDDPYNALPGAGGLHMWDCSVIHPDLKFYWSR